MSRRRDFIPALNREWLTPVYDPLIRWTMRESTFKPHLVAQARIAPGHRVLDLGCGTATLTILIKQMHPESEVTGLDIDARILDVAREKISRAGLDIMLDQGPATALSYPDDSFDRILSSLVFHHLRTHDKVPGAGWPPPKRRRAMLPSSAPSFSIAPKSPPDAGRQESHTGSPRVDPALHRRPQSAREREACACRCLLRSWSVSS